MSEVMDMCLWDMSLWEPWADQDYLMLSYESNYTAGNGWNFNYSCPELVANKSSYYDEDNGHCDFAFRYNYDIIEEDALNEKCCLQVLKVLIHKADEDILKLEEDILMLDCQLAWDNEELSEPCSVALKKRIDHLDDLIRSFKNESNYVHDVSAELEEPGKPIQRLHDLVKPLLENYFLVKSEKRPIAEKAAVTDTEEKKTLSDLKSEGYQRTAEKTCTPFSMSVKKAKTVTHKKGEDIISKIFKNAHQYAKEMAKLNKQMGKEVPKSAPAKFEKRSIITSEEPSIFIVKQDTDPSRTKKSDSRSDLTGNIEVLSTSEVQQLQFVHEIKMKNSYLKPQEKVGEVVQPSVSIVKQDTNPSKTKKSDSRGSDLTGNNEVLSTAEPDRLQFVHEIKTTDSYLKLQEKVGQVVQPSISDTDRSRTKKSDSRGSGLMGNNEILSTAEPRRLQFVHEMKTTNSYLKSKEKVGEVVQPSVSILKQDTNPSRTKKSDSRGSGLTGNNEVLSTAEPYQLQFVLAMKTTNSYLKSQEKIGEVVQPSISIVKQDTNPSRTKKSHTRGSGMRGNNEVLSTAEVHRLQFVHERKTTNSYSKSQEEIGEVVQPAYVIYGEQASEDITVTRETRAYRHAINKDLFCKKPLVKKRKRTSFPKRPDTLESREPVTVDFDDSIILSELLKLKRKNPRKASEPTKDKHQRQQIAKNLVIELDNPDYVKPDKGPWNTYVRKQEIAPVTCIPEETLQGSSLTDKGDKYIKDCAGKNPIQADDFRNEYKKH